MHLAIYPSRAVVHLSPRREQALVDSRPAFSTCATKVEVQKRHGIEPILEEVANDDDRALTS